MMPMLTIMATTMRMTLRALLPPLLAGAEDAPAGGTGAETVEPHLLQNFVPASRVAPHLLQKAMTYLVRVKSRRREYIAELMGK
jgi:hypothetical protein